MKSVFDGYYASERPLYYFEEISAIPRASGNEAAIAAYMKRFALERGLFVHEDKLHNIIIKKPGSRGMENKKPLIIQGHMDMVPDAKAGVVHDWEKDGIELVLNGNILTANGTTLGADDGIALGYMLSILDDDSLVHPPLTCIMTTMEETGLVGAFGLDPDWFRETDRMIGLDAGAEGKFLVSSAAGSTVFFKLPYVGIPLTGEPLRISISGLRGGHSGKDIHLEKGNAIKILFRILSAISKKIKFNIISAEGGSKNNAIPREASAVISIPEGRLSETKKIAEETAAEIRDELRFSDDPMRMEMNIADISSGRMADDESTSKLLYIGHVMPNGVMMRNVTIPDMVNGSLNFGVLRTENDCINGEITIRSAQDSIMENIQDTVLDILRHEGAEYRTGDAYPAFSYRECSPLRDLAAEACAEVLGRPGKAFVLHAGTEMGIFRQYNPELDCISLGPDKGAVHSPDEWLDVDSYLRSYKVLVKVLEKLCL